MTTLPAGSQPTNSQPWHLRSFDYSWCNCFWFPAATLNTRANFMGKYGYGCHPCLIARF